MTPRARSPSAALTPDRLEALKKAADALDGSIAVVSTQVKQLQHDQNSLRTSIMALQTELEREDLARVATSEGGKS